MSKRIVADHGFPCGQHFAKDWRVGWLSLTPITARQFDTLPREGRGTVAGTDARPIIDITGALIPDTFHTARVCARFTAGRIIITEHKE